MAEVLIRVRGGAAMTREGSLKIHHLLGDLTIPATRLEDPENNDTVYEFHVGGFIYYVGHEFVTELPSA